MTKLINIYALCRSGNHAIISWLIANLAGSAEGMKELRLGHGVYGMVSGGAKPKVYFRNNINHTYPVQSQFKVRNDAEWLLISREDTLPAREAAPSSVTIFILREFSNLLASRMQKYHRFNQCGRQKLFGFYSGEDYNKTYICSLDELIRVWKVYTQAAPGHKGQVSAALGHERQVGAAPNVVVIKYDQWLVDKGYRDKIMHQIDGGNNAVDCTEVVPTCGGGSSFIGVAKEKDHSAYLHRYRQIEFPPEVVKAVLNDKELVEVNERLFGVDLRTIFGEN